MSTITAPNIDAEVELVMRNAFGKSMIPPQPDTYVIRGRVLKPYKWLNDREFCLTGSDDWPVRVININRVVKMKIITGTVKTIDTAPKVFSVTGSKGEVYTVSRMSNKWTCTCKGFEFRKNCRHIAEASGTV